MVYTHRVGKMGTKSLLSPLRSSNLPSMETVVSGPSTYIHTYILEWVLEIASIHIATYTTTSVVCSRDMAYQYIYRSEWRKKLILASILIC